MSASDFNIKFGVDTSNIKHDLEKFKDYKINIDLETAKLKADIKEVFNLGDTKEDISKINALYKEFSTSKEKGEKEYRQQLVNTANLQQELVQKAVQEIEKEKQALLDTADAQAELNNVMKDMNNKLDAKDEKKRIADEEAYKQKLVATAQLQKELVEQAIVENEQEKQSILAKADAQSELDNTIKRMNATLDARDDRHVSQQSKYIEEEIVAEQKLALQKEKTGKKIDDIKNKNVSLISSHAQLKAEVDALTQSYAKATTSADFAKITKDIDKVKSSIDVVKSTGESFFTQMKENFTKFGSWMIITSSYFTVIRAIQDSIEQVMALDKELTELQKVTNLSGESLRKFTDDAFNLGQVVGRTGKDVVDATATFARAGYNVKDSLDLAETALVMTNVGDGITDVGKASDTLISILKGGNLTIADATKVLDSLNAVSNKNATSFDKLSEATTRYITVSTQAGQDLDQTLGLLTGVLEIMGGDSERAGRNLSTLTNRLLGLTDIGDDGYEGISKINTELMSLTKNTSKQISVFDENTGQLRTAYDILKELAVVYPELSKNAQVYLGNLIAGKNQIQAYNAIMQNFGAVTKATEDSMNSFGSSVQENETFINSIEGKINAFNSAWSQLSSNLWDSDAIKFFIDLGTGAIKLADGIGVLNISLGLLFGYLGASGKLTQSIFSLSTSAIPSLTASMEAGSKTAIAFGSVLNAIPLIALSTGIAFLVSEFNKYNVTIEEHAFIVEELTGKLESLKNEYNALSSAKELNETDSQKLKILEKEIALNETILAQEKQKQYSMEFEGDVSGLDKFIAKTSEFFTHLSNINNESSIRMNAVIKANVDTGELDKAIEKTAEFVNKLVEENQRYADKIAEIDTTTQSGVNSFNTLNEKIKDNSATITELIKNTSEWKSVLEENIASNIGSKDANQQLLDTINSLADGYLSLYDSVEQVNEALPEQQEKVFSLAESMSSLKNETSAISSAYGEMSNSGELSLSTVEKLISAGSEYINLLEMENGHYKINQDSLEQIFETKKASYVADAKGKQEELKNNIAVARSNLEKIKVEEQAYMASEANKEADAQSSIQIMNNIYKTAQQIGEALGYTGKALTKYVADTANSIWNNQISSAVSIAEKAISSMQTEYDGLGKSIDILSNLTLPAYAGTLNKTSTATKKMADSQKDLNKQLDEAKSKLDDIVNKYESMKDAIVGVIDADIAKLGSFTFVDTLAGQYEIFRDYLLQGLEDEMKAIEETADAEKKFWQDKIDALEAERKQEEQNKKLEDARLKIAEAQAELDKAKLARENLQKNTRVFKAGEGWQWDFDPKAVQDADQAISDAQKKIEDAKKSEQQVKDDILFEDTKKKYEDEIAEIDRLKQAQLDSVQAQIDAMNKLSESWGNNSQEILAEILKQTNAEEFMEQWETANQAERIALLEQFSSSYKTNVDGQILKLTEQKEDFLLKYEKMREALGLFTDVEKFTQEFEQASYETRQAMLEQFTIDFQNEYTKQKEVIEDLQDALEKIIDLQAEVAGASDALDRAEKKLADKKTNSTTKKPTSGGSGTGANASLRAFADGGTRLVDYTGMEKNGSGDWMDGTRAKPEIILNNTDAGKLYDLVHNRAVPNETNVTTTDNKKSIVIQHMEVKAESVDSLDNFINMLSQKTTTS